MTQAVLIDTGPVCYIGGGALVWCPARTWRLDERTMLGIVTVTCDADEFAGELFHGIVEDGCSEGMDVRIVLHYIATGQYAEQWRGVTGRVHTTAVPADALRELLGDTLDASAPTGPVVCGIYPSRLAESWPAWS